MEKKNAHASAAVWTELIDKAKQNLTWKKEKS